MKKIISILIPIFFILTYLSHIYFKNNLTMVLNILFAIMFSLYFIPTIFYELLIIKSNKLLKYHGTQVLYVFFPLSLVGQLLVINQPMIVFITFIISTSNLFILYKYYRNIIKINIRFLRYSNMLLIGILTFLITLLCLYNNSFEKTVIFILITPLVNLRILFEKIDIKIENNNSEICKTST